MDAEEKREALPLGSGWEEGSFSRSPLPSVPGSPQGGPRRPLCTCLLQQQAVGFSLHPSLGLRVMAPWRGPHGGGASGQYVGQVGPAGGSLSWGCSRSSEGSKPHQLLLPDAPFSVLPWRRRARSLTEETQALPLGSPQSEGRQAPASPFSDQSLFSSQPLS